MEFELSILPLPPQTGSSNDTRGQLGSLLFHQDKPLYDELFSPSAQSGPSGLHDRPRPFVIRPQAIHVFSPALTPRLAKLLQTPIQTLRWPLDPIPAQRIRIDFLTPTELKHAGGLLHTPHFPALAARARDRICSILSLYQNQPTDHLDFASLSAAAEAIALTASQITIVPGELRRSARNQNLHSLGGFLGWAEYSGTLDALLPYLIAAQWAGVGRQTVWGKGELKVTVLPFEECVSSS